MSEPNDKSTSDESREKGEQRARIVGLDVREVSLVDKAANEREFLVVKNLDGGDAMNPEATQEPTETDVEKALDLTRQLMKEKGEMFMQLAPKIADMSIDDKGMDLAHTLMYKLDRGRGLMGVMKSEGVMPENEIKKAIDADAEKASATFDKARKLVDKAIGMVGDNKDLAAVLGEVKELLAAHMQEMKNGKYPYPYKKKEEGAVNTETEKKDETTTEAEAEKQDETTETADAEKTDDAAGDTSEAAETESTEAEKADAAATDEDTEKRASALGSLVKELKGQRKSIDDTIKRVEEVMGGKQEKPEDEEKKPEEMKALKATIDEHGKALGEIKKTLDAIVKTRGTSKAADESTVVEDRSKGDDIDWSNVL